MFTPRFLTIEQISQAYQAAVAEIEARLLVGHINDVIDPARQGHYDEGGAHEGGSAAIERLLADHQDLTQRMLGTAMSEPVAAETPASEAEATPLTEMVAAPEEVPDACP